MGQVLGWATLGPRAESNVSLSGAGDRHDPRHLRPGPRAGAEGGYGSPKGQSDWEGHQKNRVPGPQDELVPQTSNPPATRCQSCHSAKWLLSESRTWLRFDLTAIA